VKEVHVFYDGGDNFLDCLDRGTCPTCLLEGRKHSGSSFAQSVGFESTTMVPDPGSPQNTQNMVLTAMSIEWDASSGVYCSVPPGITIKGVAARVTEGIVISAF
jgi:hypothetical protein